MVLKACILNTVSTYILNKYVFGNMFDPVKYTVSTLCAAQSCLHKWLLLALPVIVVGLKKIHEKICNDVSTKSPCGVILTPVFSKITCFNLDDIKLLIETHTHLYKDIVISLCGQTRSYH